MQQIAEWASHPQNFALIISVKPWISRHWLKISQPFQLKCHAHCEFDFNVPSIKEWTKITEASVKALLTLVSHLEH